jgi:hypothetical protein
MKWRGMFGNFISSNVSPLGGVGLKIQPNFELVSQRVSNMGQMGEFTSALLRT